MFAAGATTAAGLPLFFRNRAASHLNSVVNSAKSGVVDSVSYRPKLSGRAIASDDRTNTMSCPCAARHAPSSRRDGPHCLRYRCTQRPWSPPSTTPHRENVHARGWESINGLADVACLLGGNYAYHLHFKIGKK